jgi:hypothetical protein
MKWWWIMNYSLRKLSDPILCRDSSSAMSYTGRRWPQEPTSIQNKHTLITTYAWVILVLIIFSNIFVCNHCINKFWFLNMLSYLIIICQLLILLHAPKTDYASLHSSRNGWHHYLLLNLLWLLVDFQYQCASDIKKHYWKYKTTYIYKGSIFLGQNR